MYTISCWTNYWTYTSNLIRRCFAVLYIFVNCVEAIVYMRSACAMSSMESYSQRTSIPTKVHRKFVRLGNCIHQIYLFCWMISSAISISIIGPLASRPSFLLDAWIIHYSCVCVGSSKTDCNKLDTIASTQVAECSNEALLHGRSETNTGSSNAHTSDIFIRITVARISITVYKHLLFEHA